MTEMLNDKARPSWFSASLMASLNKHRDSVPPSDDITEDETGFFLYDLDSLKQHLSLLMQQDVIKLRFVLLATKGLP